MKDGKKVVKQLIFEIGLNINRLCFADKKNKCDEKSACGNSGWFITD